ncbi:MAG: hypothetical protein KKA10_04125 [Euryarchaeota archaeon]|nr:hypothetical protein [Euryarchaeota archaeon]MCG2738485.1 hypothetical protein [Candidatus Methanoperedenaceae archaeon]
MQDGSLSGLDLEFLYYETPVGKVRRNKQFGREHIDILAKEMHSKALVVVEVKKQGEDMDSAVFQGLSYVEWLFKHRERLKPRIAQLDINAHHRLETRMTRIWRISMYTRIHASAEFAFLS